MESSIIGKENPVPHLGGIDVNRPIGLALETFVSNEERVQLQVKDLTLDTATLKFLLTQQSHHDGGIQFVTHQEHSLQQADGVNIQISNLGNDLQTATSQGASTECIQNSSHLFQAFNAVDKDILCGQASKRVATSNFADDEQKIKFVARKFKNIKANIDELYKKAGVTAMALVACNGDIQFAGPDHMLSLEESDVFKSLFWNAVVDHENVVDNSKAQSSGKNLNGRDKSSLLSWPCDECRDCFSTQHNLVNHKLLVHSGLSAHKCEFCGKEFVDAVILQKHLTIHSGKNSFQCKICGNSFAGKNLLDSHMKIHNSDKRHSCKICGKAFNSSSSLQYHVSKHTGDKKCVCVHCSKEFTKMSSLKVHMRIHSGEQPYRCQECGKGFVVSTHLTRHLRVHSGERPYLCEVCGKRFNRSSHLRIHFRIHSGEKPYECEICGKRFNQTVTRKKHLKTHAK